MGTLTASSRKRAWKWALAAGAVLALVVPAIALAANTASFSSLTPKSGSSSTNTRPTIAATVYDRYGAHGSGAITMTLDGKSVKPAVTYIITGSFNPAHPDYRRFKLSYRPSSALRAGTHKVSLRIKDAKSKVSTASWSFTVKGPEPAYSATFSSAAPANGSSSTNARPTISVSAYDKYGVKGTGTYKMTIDGSAVSPSISYTKSGYYTSFKLSFRPSSNLSVGTHTVVANVHDLHSHDTRYTWAFTVEAPPVVLDAMPVAGTACADCHVGYPAAHPMQQCQLCHGDGRPVASAVTPADQSAHTLGCALETPCHGGGGAFPHVLSSDCSSCHDNPTYIGIPQTHSLQVESLHVAPTTFCTQKGCHVTSLTVEHYRYTVNGTRLSCATCHGSTDPAVVAAIAAKSTTCTDCHDLTAKPHPNAAAAHTAVGSCIATGCHGADVTATHKGDCSRCHAAGKTPSTTCASCHASGTYHSAMATKHTLSAGGCVATGCHGTDAASVHKNNCARCHTGTGTPTTTCLTCHTKDTLALHPNATASHTAAAIACTTPDCHGTDVTAIHVVNGDSRCTACHAADKTPSAVCANCHDSDIRVVHAKSAASHTATDTTCISPVCHPDGDVTAIHDKANGGPGCAACHDPGKKPTLLCATEGCHAGAIEVIHAKAGASHSSTTTACVSSGCHVADVTLLHKNAPLGCGSCHQPGKPVTAVCTTCHGTDKVTLHKSADTSHTVAPDMCVTSCHSTNVSEIHTVAPNGCLSCHVTGTKLSTTCSDCHTGTIQALHTSAGTAHTVVNTSCVLDGCHGNDLTVLHAKTGGQGCPRCHSPLQTPTADCTTCHGGDLLSVHSSADTSHTMATGSSCGGAICHETNVASIHTHVGGPGCKACHAPDKTPSVDCSTCHSTDIVAVHQRADASHSIPAGGSCYTPTCHNSGNAATIHQPSASSCSVCHAAGVTVKTIVCATCHSSAQIPTLHASADTSHTAAVGDCVKSGCHASNVLLLHINGPSCGACHSAGAPTTLVCTTGGCHSATLGTVHAKGAVPHVAHAGYCIRSGCHGGDVTTIHDANGKGPGCAACHAPDKTPSNVCTDCHPATTQLVHASSDTSHTVAQNTCAGYTGTSPCHHARVDMIHIKAPNGCLSCHAQDTTPSVVCADCHVGANAPTHSSAEATSHVAASGLCINSQCHDADVSVIHANSTKSCLACHGPDSTGPSVTCANCHSTDAISFHKNAATLHLVPAGTTCIATGCHSGTDVSAIHSVAGGPGCTACHDAGKFATTDCSVPACHGSDLAVTHAKGDTFHKLPTIPPTTDCVRSGCHTGNAIQVHAGGPGCAACHSNPNHGPSIICSDCHTGVSSVHTPYIGTKHDPEAGPCTSSNCHSWTVSRTHNQVAGVYSPTGGPGCVVCHTTGPLTVTCTTCHNATTNTPTHAPAATSHTAPAGTCTGCHGTNVSVIHVTADGAVHCDACHAAGVTPSTTCSNAAPCHGAGFPAGHPAPPEKHASADNCTTLCHSTNVATIHATVTTSHPIPPGCVACHDGVKTPATVCANCHASGTYHGVAATKHAVSTTCNGTSCHPSDVSVIHVKAGVQMCVDCHATGVDPAIKGTDCTQCHGSSPDHTSLHASCNGCHGDPGHYDGPTAVGSTANTGYYAQYNNCLACHGQGGTWTHPRTCHGCDGMGADGDVWTGLW